MCWVIIFAGPSIIVIQPHYHWQSTFLLLPLCEWCNEVLHSSGLQNFHSNSVAQEIVWICTLYIRVCADLPVCNWVRSVVSRQPSQIVPSNMNTWADWDIGQLCRLLCVFLDGWKYHYLVIWLTHCWCRMVGSSGRGGLAAPERHVTGRITQHWDQHQMCKPPRINMWLHNYSTQNSDKEPSERR